MSKQTKSIAILSVIITLLATTAVYGIAFAIKLPLPFIKDGTKRVDYSMQNYLVERWEEARPYKYRQEIISETMNETDDGEDVEISNEERDEFLKIFSDIDGESLDKHIEENEESLKQGYSKLFIDATVKDAKSTGIKTKNGDNVLAVSSKDQLVLIDVDVSGNKGKLAIIKRSLELSVVEDLTYLDDISVHAERGGAILAVNASAYTWNSTRNYGTLYGLALRKNDLIRRGRTADNSIGFTESGELKLGASVGELYNAIEYYPHLIVNGETVYSASNENRMARTLIGQRENGDILLLVVDGEVEKSGATLSEALAVMKKYDAHNASTLSDGVCTTMWFNGKIVNKLAQGRSTSVKLPTVWVLKESVGVSAE